MRGTFARKENEDGGIFFNALFEHLVYSVKQRNWNNNNYWEQQKI